MLAFANGWCLTTSLDDAELVNCKCLKSLGGACTDKISSSVSAQVHNDSNRSCENFVVQLK